MLFNYHDNSFHSSSYEGKCLLCGTSTSAVICDHCLEGYSPQRDRDEAAPAEPPCCANERPHLPGGIHCMKD